MTEQEIDWTAVRADYEAGERSTAWICETHAITNWTLYQRRKAEGWKPRRAYRPVTRSNLIVRLYRLLERQIGDLEMRTGEFGDKEVSILGNLTRNLEKLTELDRKANGTGETKRKRSDIDAMRRKLVKRLEQLRKQ